MIKDKWNQHIPNVPGGRRFSMRFPNSTKVECTIDEATPKVLELVLIVDYKQCLSNNCVNRSCMRSYLHLEAVKGHLISTVLCLGN